MKKLFFSIVFTTLLVSQALNVNAQGVGINPSGNAPDASAMLDVSSTTKGTLITRMTIAQRNAINSPAKGLIIYNLDCDNLNCNAGTPAVPNWVSVYPAVTFPSTPTAGTHAPSTTQIVWSWNTVSGADGYKYNTTNNYSTATDNGANLSYTKTGLICNTAYTLYVWAYSACGNSTTVGILTQTTSACPFICGSSTLTDSRDGQTYSTVLIGSQCWMGQNLNYGNYVPIHSGAQIAGEKYCTNLSSANDNTCSMGGIYEWANIMNGSTSCNGTGSGQPGCSIPIQGICPVGWHIPSHYELTLLEQTESTNPSAFPYDVTTKGFLGTDEGNKLKEAGTNHWFSNTGATNSSGFTGFGGGDSGGGSFSLVGQYGFWWSCTESSGSEAWDRALNKDVSSVNRDTNAKSFGFSLRCIKD